MFVVLQQLLNEIQTVKTPTRICFLFQQWPVLISHPRQPSLYRWVGSQCWSVFLFFWLNPQVKTVSPIVYITCNRSVNIFLFGSKGSDSGAAGRASKSILYSMLFPITREQVTIVSLLMGCFAQVYMSHANLDNLNKQDGLMPQLFLLHIPISKEKPETHFIALCFP